VLETALKVLDFLSSATLVPIPILATVPSLQLKLECGPMPNMMATLPNIGGAICSTLQSLPDAHY